MSTHDEFVPRERLPFTFLRVEDHEARLLYWSPGRRKRLPVILLEEEVDPFNRLHRRPVQAE